VTVDLGFRRSGLFGDNPPGGRANDIFVRDFSSREHNYFAEAEWDLLEERRR